MAIEDAVRYLKEQQLLSREAVIIESTTTYSDPGEFLSTFARLLQTFLGENKTLTITPTQIERLLQVLFMYSTFTSSNMGIVRADQIEGTAINSPFATLSLRGTTVFWTPLRS